jgi:hypothetical protein
VSTELGPLSQIHNSHRIAERSRNPTHLLTLLDIRQYLHSMASGIPIYDLASNGDVILTLRLTRLRVSSAVLSTASPVFRAMFGPDFLVGQNVHSPKNPKEIPLPEDDSHGMMRLCYLLHHQRDPNDSSPMNVSSIQGAKEFLTMARLADKYGCTHSVNMVSAEPLSYFENPSAINAGPSIEALLHLIAATYILDDRRQFARFTGYLVLYYEKPYSGLKQPVLALLPSLFLRKKSSSRTKTGWSRVLTMMTVHVEERRKATLKALRDKASKVARVVCLPCSRDGSLVGAQCQHRQQLEEWVETENNS